MRSVKICIYISHVFETAVLSHLTWAISTLVNHTNFFVWDTYLTCVVSHFWDTTSFKTFSLTVFTQLIPKRWNIKLHLSNRYRVHNYRYAKPQISFLKNLLWLILDIGCWCANSRSFEFKFEHSKLCEFEHRLLKFSMVWIIDFVVGLLTAKRIEN